jgi:hypothetical protein
MEPREAKNALGKRCVGELVSARLTSRYSPIGFPFTRGVPALGAGPRPSAHLNGRGGGGTHA